MGVLDGLGEALQVLAEVDLFGVACQFIIPTDDVTDPTFDATCIVPTNYSKGSIDGTRIQDSDLKVHFNGASWTPDDERFGIQPAKDMTIKIFQDTFKLSDGDYKELTIVSVNPFVTGDNVAGWDLQVRGV